MKEIKALIVMTSAYYQQQLPDHVVEMYAEELQDIDFTKLSEALRTIRRDPRVTRFPLPAQIRQVAKPETVTDEQEAIEASNRILQAMGKFGWVNPEGARKFMGELAWKVVEREGGWRDMCERTTNDDLPILKAQWRELAKSLQARSRAGKIDEAPALPRPVNAHEELEYKP